MKHEYEPKPSLDIRPCAAGELPQVLALEETVISRLEDPSLLRKNSLEMWQRCLQPPHYSLGAWAETQLIALAVLYVPGEEDREALAPLLQTVNPVGHKAAHYKICLVHPDWRGNHLQVRLGQLLHTEALHRGCDLLCATASPLNTASIKSLQQLGYTADCKLKKYGSERILFYKLN